MNIVQLLNIGLTIVVPLAFLTFIYFLDFFSTPKQRRTVFGALLWGAVGAFMVAYLTNNGLIQPIVNQLGGNNDVIRGVTAPVTEEIAKALVLIYLIWLPSFRYLVDGAIYGFAAGIGFAISETLFFVLSRNLPFADVLMRVISTTLMHATASALVGIGLGRSRRAEGGRRYGVIGLGFVLAMVLHAIYNNVSLIRGVPVTGLLLTAIAIGAFGMFIILNQINRGLADEKSRIGTTLGISEGVTAGESAMAGQFGSENAEKFFEELEGRFGRRKAENMRRLLVVQANMSILKNNLKTAVSERLKGAWEKEFGELSLEKTKLQRKIGAYAMTFIRAVYGEDTDTEWQHSFDQMLSSSDAVAVHQFDMFMSLSERAGTFEADRLGEIAAQLQRASIFKDVSLEDLENLSRAVTEESLRHDEVLFRQGDVGDTLYLIQSGRIALYKIASDGDEQLLRTCAPGEVVGELALIDGSPRSALARAQGDLMVLRLRREHFNMFVKSRPSVIVAMLSFLADRVRDTTRSLEVSVNWATQIAQGKYQEARSLGMLAPQADIAVAAEAITAAATPAVLQRAPSADTAVAIPLKLGGAFSRVASLLEQREKVITSEMQAPKHVTADLTDMPAHLRPVMQAILRAHESDGVTIAMLIERLPEVADVSAKVRELDELGWLSTQGTSPDVRYKAQIRRKQGRTLSSLTAWAKLGKDYADDIKDS